MAQITPLTGTSGQNNFVVSGDPFNGIDVSADGRQVVNQPSELNAFLIAEDRFVLDATDLGITLPTVFVNGTVEELTNSSIANANTVVIQGAFANAGAAAVALAGTGVASGPGVFVYFNQTLQINRLVFSADLGSATADISILGNIRTLTGDAAQNALPTFTTNNFLLAPNTVIGDDNNNILLGTAAQDFIDGFGGNDLIDGGAASDTLTGGTGSDTFAFSGDPFDGADVSPSGRQVIGNEDFVTDFDFDQDNYQLNASDFGVSGDVNFVALDANAANAHIPTGANVIVLLNADNDNNPATAFNAGTAASQIANLVNEDGAGFFVYFNSGLQLNRLVYSTNLNDPTADLKILARQSDLTGQLAIDALANFSADNFEFQNRTLDTSGGQQIIQVGVGETLQVKNFGGVGQGPNGTRSLIEEVDTLQFTGDGLTAENLQLTQVGADLEISFLQDTTNTKVVLQNFGLENLDNLKQNKRTDVARGNIIFSNETGVEDSFDVFNANTIRGSLFNRNTVTFLNDLDNIVHGFNHSNDVINAQGGDDRVSGLGGDDILRGGLGNDTLLGGKGHDSLYGDAGTDILTGGNGDDLLRGGAGSDTLEGDNWSGGYGSDIFVLAPGEGNDFILDFQVGVDFIGLTAGLNFGDLSFVDNTIRFGQETLATLTGVNTTTLDASAFVQV
jgi:Ca2+-binding RTX toxin-like protein